MNRNIGQIIAEIDSAVLKGSPDTACGRLCIDSRQVGEGDAFVALRGTRIDGHAFIEAVLDAGATVIVAETEPQAALPEGVAWVRVTDSSKAAGLMAAAWYEHPSRKLKLTGVTGTNGKTTAVSLMFGLFQALGYRCGMLSTIGNRIGDQEFEATHTTPDAIRIQEMLSRMVEARCTHAFMEVSSHSAVQNRIEGLDFALALFTNITHDHLDYHGTFDKYILAKKSFFDRLGSDAVALVNADDRHAGVMVQNTAAEVQRYGLFHDARYRARILENSFDGMHLQIDGHDFYSPLIGSFNASNLLAAYAAGCALEEEPTRLLVELSRLGPPRGRFDYVRSDRGITGIVDYAHSPDALEHVLETLRDIRRAGQKIITVVGCGGDRDRSKRPVMAGLAARLSDRAILTSDNPRTEDPEAILDEMMDGLRIEERLNLLRITDRTEAIRAACMLASPGDLVLVAGKGHETYQEIAGVRHPFDDRAQLCIHLQPAL
ncbi:MAG: UDP-N-acetylmuramoyl-L-alanyl-D-glutamate--2,6-diaminopimelate ligase [Sphingomonadales bacterium]|nr:UDP-N-acetylmuramoyl-L-alanyl-D-glutamate--2,6-diaminopimelate ligase [Sphingomonadales bacterium]